MGCLPWKGEVLVEFFVSKTVKPGCGKQPGFSILGEQPMKKSGRKERISPETTIAGLFIVLFYVSFIDSYRLLGITAALAVVYSMVVCKNNNVFRLVKPVLPFVVLMLVPTVFSYLLTGTFGQVDFVWIITGKVLISSILLGTVIVRHSALYLVEGVLNMGLPPVFNRIFALTFRYFHMIYEDIEKGRKALISRGLYARRGLSYLGIFGEWIGGFFLKSSDHGDKVFQAMQARGFNGETKVGSPLAPALIVKSSLWIAVLTIILIIDGKI